MRRLVYQVYLGEKSKLYDWCVQSVADYCSRMGYDHIVQREGILRIVPDFSNPRCNRSKESISKVGYLPIFEKENAFDYLYRDEYDQVAIIDADIYVRKDLKECVFESFLNENGALITGEEVDLGAVFESSMPSLPWHLKKLKTYGRMQYGSLPESDRPLLRDGIFHFFNMGLMVLNKSILSKTGTSSAREFLARPDFKRFIDGEEHWKWSTDQTLLNYWAFCGKGVNTVDTLSPDSWTWNALYSTFDKKLLPEARLIHYFLRDKLPRRGENVDELRRELDE